MPLQTPLIHVEAIAAFKDNYIWLLSRHDSKQAWVVDPGDALPVLEYLEKKRLHLEGILLTHRHPDHDGGIPILKQHFPRLRVISGLHSESPHGTEHLPDGATLEVFDRTFQLIDVAGHTKDHIAFYCSAESLLFCGDTLFAGGCGRLFDGSAEQLFTSLSRIASLPGNTLNYCAHEYTVNNLRFALTLEPDNIELQQRAKDTEALRAKDLPSIPSFLSLELRTNPFLRCHEPSIIAAACAWSGAKLDSPLDVFTAIRIWKDRF